MNEETADDAANAAIPPTKHEGAETQERVAQRPAADSAETKTAKPPVRPRKTTNKSSNKSGESKGGTAPAYPEPETVGGHEPMGKPRKHHRNHRRKTDSTNSADLPFPPNARVDAAQLECYAWKIFKGEVVEEGLALMDDRAAAETAHRAFRVAEIFLTEAAQHRPPQEESTS